MSTILMHFKIISILPAVKQYLFWWHKSCCATKKDVAPKSPRTSTVLGLFRCLFSSANKKIPIPKNGVLEGLEPNRSSFQADSATNIRWNLPFYIYKFVK